MRVLVTAASKYGSTREIAEAIADVLQAREIDTHVAPPENVDRVDKYDAVVLGSAVYGGHWMRDAREFVERSRDRLAGKPVWLFSSGPIGDPPKPEEEAVDVAEVFGATRARDHVVFPGKLDRHKLSFAERAIAMALRAPDGDFRDWDAIKAWAGTIADSLEG